MSALRVAVAPNAFKGTLTAQQAAEAIGRGVEAALPDAVLLFAPIADGGDGSVDAFVTAGYTRQSVVVRDALGESHAADIAIRDGHAVVEVANTCGLALLGGARHPLTSSTVGLGDAMREALALGVDHITVCLGGSASTDGGAGMLVALGARLLDADGHDVAPCGQSLDRVEVVDLNGLVHPPNRVIVDVIADVTSPLHGPHGAAEIFAPQKGASPGEVEQLDVALRHWGRLLAEATGRDVADLPGSGAAGGTGAALAAIFDAKVDGAAALLTLLNMPSRLAEADLVITGEGCLDSSTLAGKGCAVVVVLAHTLRIPVLTVCGRIDLDSRDIRVLGVAGAWESNDSGDSAAESLASTTMAGLREWQEGSLGSQHQDRRESS
jgi:glycerate kinase